jgi:hypothetical protein
MTMRIPFSRWRNRGLTSQAAVLAGAVLAVYAAVAPVAGALSGMVGVAAAAVAAGLCLAGAALALLVCRLYRDPKGALWRVLIGMFLRMGVPLLGGLAIQVQGGRLAKAGVLVYLVVFYPLTLFVETFLSLPSHERPQRQGDVSEKVVL